MNRNDLSRKDITIQAISYLGLKTKNPVTYSMDEVMVSCPIHQDDKNPSMGIDLNRGICNCFACGWSGNIEQLFKEITGESLYKVLGIQTDQFSIFARPEIKVYKSLIDEDSEYKLKNVYLNYNKSSMVSALQSRLSLKYLRSRGIEDSIAKKFNLMYAHETYINGVVYKDRLFVPIYEDHRLISFECRRILDNDEKKVLYPRNCVVNTLFDIDNLNTEEPLYIVEGLMDLLVLRSCDTFKNSTSIFGASLTNRQKYILRKFKKIIYINDLDEAGFNSVEEFKKAHFSDFSILELPSEISGIQIKDVGDLPKANVTPQDLVDRHWLHYVKNITNYYN